MPQHTTYLRGALAKHVNDLWRKEVSVLGEHLGAAVLDFASEVLDFEAEVVPLGPDVVSRLDVVVELLCNKRSQKGDDTIVSHIQRVALINRGTQ